MDDISFIHLTDLHAADPHGETWLGLDPALKLRRVLEAVRGLQLEPAFFVVSGDLVNGANRVNYEALKASIAEIETFGVPVLLGLGNHDSRYAH